MWTILDRKLPEIEPEYCDSPICLRKSRIGSVYRVDILTPCTHVTRKLLSFAGSNVRILHLPRTVRYIDEDALDSILSPSSIVSIEWSNPYYKERKNHIYKRFGNTNLTKEKIMVVKSYVAMSNL